MPYGYVHKPPRRKPRESGRGEDLLATALRLRHQWVEDGNHLDTVTELRRKRRESVAYLAALVYELLPEEHRMEFLRLLAPK